jgi:hypothetical protein
LVLTYMPLPDRDTDLDPELVRIVERAIHGARVLRAERLGADASARDVQTTEKAAGYGVPIRIEVELDSSTRSFVLHGASSNPFGHNRRADRAAELILAADTHRDIPRHVRALDVGAQLTGLEALTESPSDVTSPERLASAMHGPARCTSPQTQRPAEFGAP